LACVALRWPVAVVDVESAFNAAFSTVSAARRRRRFTAAFLFLRWLDISAGPHRMFARAV